MPIVHDIKANTIILLCLQLIIINRLLLFPSVPSILGLCAFRAKHPHFTPADIRDFEHFYKIAFTHGTVCLNTDFAVHLFPPFFSQMRDRDPGTSTPCQNPALPGAGYLQRLVFLFIADFVQPVSHFKGFRFIGMPRHIISSRRVDPLEHKPFI